MRMTSRLKLRYTILYATRGFNSIMSGAARSGVRFVKGCIGKGRLRITPYEAPHCLVMRMSLAEAG